MADLLHATQAARLRTPPTAAVATGHEDEVYLWITRIADPAATARLLSELITVGETARVARIFAATGGLVAKRLDVDVARALQERLAALGTDAVLVRPEEVDALVDPE